MTTQTMTLTDFLLARIAEDEAKVTLVKSAPPKWTMTVYPHDGERLPVEVAALTPARVLAESEAKRDIVREHQGYGGICGTCGVRKPETGELWPCRTLRLLSFPYLDHPDYDEEWRP